MRDTQTTLRWSDHGSAAAGDRMGTGGKGSDANTGRGRFPASSSQSGICAAVALRAAQSLEQAPLLIARAECLFCALPLCSFKAARAFLSCRFGVPEQSVAKAIAALQVQRTLNKLRKRFVHVEAPWRAALHGQSTYRACARAVLWCWSGIHLRVLRFRAHKRRPLVRARVSSLAQLQTDFGGIQLNATKYILQ